MGEDEKKNCSDEETRRVNETLAWKFDLLAKHFGITWDNDNSWPQLAVQLAFAHVPGMQIIDTPKKQRGRPSRHNPMFFQVNLILIERKKGITDAIRAWKKRNNSKDSVPRLEARYYRERRMIKKLAMEMNTAMDRVSLE